MKKSLLAISSMLILNFSSLSAQPGNVEIIMYKGKGRDRVKINKRTLSTSTLG